jgi:hypothetical protein
MLILLSSTIKPLSVMLPVPLPSIIIMYPQSFIILILNFSNLISKKNHFRLILMVVTVHGANNWFEIIRPNSPSNFRLVELSSCTEWLNIFSLFSTLIPRPVSLENFKLYFLIWYGYLIYIRYFSKLVNFNALLNRFTITCFSLTESASMCFGTFEFRFNTKSIFFCFCWWLNKSIACHINRCKFTSFNIQF